MNSRGELASDLRSIGDGVSFTRGRAGLFFLGFLFECVEIFGELLGLIAQVADAVSEGGGQRRGGRRGGRRCRGR